MDYTINVRGRLMDFATPKVMGILNVTPDSFYAGSRKQTERQIVERAEEILAQGGSIIDIGGFSTRPGAQVVSEDEECRRLKWSVGLVRQSFPDAVISVDTYRPRIARQCIADWGADIINDVSEGGITGIVDTPIHEEERMFDVVGQLQCPYILMSVKPNAHDMMIAFADEVQQLRDRGCKDIILDPGFGFGKTVDENYRLMDDLDQLQVLNLPLLVGISRKSMIYRTIGGDATSALNGSTVLHTISLLKGASILRVHDVAEAVEAVAIVGKLKGGPQAR